MLTGNALTRYSARRGCRAVPAPKNSASGASIEGDGRSSQVTRRRASDSSRARSRGTVSFSARIVAGAGMLEQRAPAGRGSSVDAGSPSLALSCRRDVGPGSGDQLQHLRRRAACSGPRLRIGWRAACPRRTGGRCSSRCRRTCASTPSGTSARTAIGTHIRSAPLVADHVHVSGVGNVAAGSNIEFGDRLVRVGGAGLLDDVVGAVDLVVPRAAVPVVVAGEVQDAAASDVERDVEVVGRSGRGSAGVGRAVAAVAVVGAAHVGAHADALLGPAVPLP